MKRIFNAITVVSMLILLTTGCKKNFADREEQASVSSFTKTIFSEH